MLVLQTGYSMLVTLAVATCLVSASDKNCRVVDIATLRAIAKEQGQHPSFSSTGFQYTSGEGTDWACFKTDVTVPGFKEKDPKTFVSFQEIARGLITEAEQSNSCPWDSESVGESLEKLGVSAPLCSAEALLASKVSTRALPGCGKVCEGDGYPCLYPCVCRFDRTYIDQWGEGWSVYRCKGYESPRPLASRMWI